MRILIVDDSEVNQLVLQAILEKAGYTELIAVDSANEAFNQLGMDNPSNVSPEIDLILMDIMMPEIDGIEACRQIKANQRLRDIPIIMVTALTETTDLEAAFAAGAMDYITKPFKKLELLARVRSALALKHELDRRKIREQKLLKDLCLAKRVQQSVLSRPISNPRIEIAAAYVPSQELSGDMYYWCDIDQHRYGILLLDVVGHGVSASLISMSVRSLLRGLITRLVDPVRVVRELNRHIHNLFGKDKKLSFQYFTAIYVMIDTQKREIEYVNAGHPPGLILQQDQTVLSLDRSSVPIGFRAEMPVEKRTLSYSKPLKIILYTDGLIEVPGKSILASIQNLKDFLRHNQHMENQSLIERVIADREQREDLIDDICLISITIHD
ncbi:PP2C family protein-serine/threonine phosphatase [Effusibacillus consociatus]|uniref:PP2C family protein-serine/threonine phosphatase n=1 Tax=Effusibacillus consociatus TaxID=1117041 RepID=A0ABV9Q2H8_9BACL